MNLVQNICVVNYENESNPFYLAELQKKKFIAELAHGWLYNTRDLLSDI